LTGFPVHLTVQLRDTEEGGRIETCELNAVEPYHYLADVITRIVDGHPNSYLDELLP